MRCVCPWQRSPEWAACSSFWEFLLPLKYEKVYYNLKLCGRWSSWDTEDRRKDCNEIHLCISQSLSQIWTCRKRESTLNAELGRKVPPATGELLSNECLGWLTLLTSGAIRKPPKTDLSGPKLRITRVTQAVPCWEEERCKLTPPAPRGNKTAAAPAAGSDSECRKPGADTATLHLLLQYILKN